MRCSEVLFRSAADSSREPLNQTALAYFVFERPLEYEARSSPASMQGELRIQDARRNRRSESKAKGCRAQPLNGVLLKAKGALTYADGRLTGKSCSDPGPRWPEHRDEPAKVNAEMAKCRKTLMFLSDSDRDSQRVGLLRSAKQPAAGMNRGRYLADYGIIQFARGDR